MATSADFERRLRQAGLRVTRPRVAVLTAVRDHPHADTDSIIGAVREDLGAVSHQAVYDVLRALTSAGLVRCLQPKGSVARYEGRVWDNHHHIVCRSCGSIADVDCAVGYAPCLTPDDDADYQIDEAEVIFWGRCPTCAQAAPADSSAHHTPTDGGDTAVPVPALGPQSATPRQQAQSRQESDPGV